MGAETSIPILSNSEGGISINTSALDIVLDQVGERPFVLYSINGAKRTGKSYILNKFLAYLRAKEKSESNDEDNWMEDFYDNFINWRGGMEGHTVGINMWSKPFIRKIDGREIAILLMETQGSFDDQTSQHQNSIVFTISSLLSSVLIFNTIRDLREDTLQFLQLFSGFSKTLKENSSQSEVKSTEKLIFLIRDMEYADYAYGYYDDTHCPDGQPVNLMQHILKSKEEQPTELKKVREDIATSYQDIGLFALPHPGKQLARKDSEENLDSIFKVYLKEFVELMLSAENLKTKHLGGIEVTGKEFKKIVHSWAGVLSGNQFPEINSIYENTVEIQNTIALDKGINVYVNEMNELIANNPTGISYPDFELAHESGLEKSISTFQQSKRIGGAELEMRSIVNLRENIKTKKDNYFGCNQRNREAEEQRVAEQSRLPQENEKISREFQEADGKQTEEVATLKRQTDVMRQRKLQNFSSKNYSEFKGFNKLKLQD